MKPSPLFYRISFIATLAVFNSATAWSSTELPVVTKATTAVKGKVASTKTIKPKVAQAKAVTPNAADTNADTSAAATLAGIVAPVATSAAAIANSSDSPHSANPYMVNSGISIAPTNIAPSAPLAQAAAISVPVTVAVAPVTEYKLPTSAPVSAYLAQNYQPQNYAAPAAMAAPAMPTLPTLPPQLMFSAEDAAHFLGGLGNDLKKSLPAMPNLSGSSQSMVGSTSGSIGRMLADLKMRLPLTGDSNILPSIKKVYPTGEKPLVVINFKCPTEIIGITPPPMKLLHEALNLGFDGLNKTDLLSFNLQQVCS